MKIVGQNELFDDVLWKDSSHRLQGGDDEFLKPPSVYETAQERNLSERLYLSFLAYFDRGLFSCLTEA